tara:strand:- start:18 stop:539 length:522 start_codon:yes stop_codon:yes gene_type:complete
MIELELTYLAKSVPQNIKDCPNKVIIDLYIENGTDHSDLRIRKNADRFELTRKTPVEDGDASKQTEITINISETEFNSFLPVKARRVEKIRYFCDFEGRTAEFDVFTGDLEGLVVVDFEFGDEKEKDLFQMPEFCLADITQEKFIAGGVLAGRSYEDVKDELSRFGYEKLIVQ